MAKKNAARRKDKGAGGAPNNGFANKSYEGEHFSATFEYNELCLVRAAELMAPRLKNVLLAANFVALLAIIFVAIVAEGFVALIVVLFIISVGLYYAVHNWSKLQLRYARSTNLLPRPGVTRYRVVVCNDAVHAEDDQGGEESFDLASLAHVNANSESILACFGEKRYVYIPRSALSETRFRELTHFLDEKIS